MGGVYISWEDDTLSRRTSQSTGSDGVERLSPISGPFSQSSRLEATKTTPAMDNWRTDKRKGGKEARAFRCVIFRWISKSGSESLDQFTCSWLSTAGSSFGRVLWTYEVERRTSASVCHHDIIHTRAAKEVGQARMGPTSEMGRGLRHKTLPMHVIEFAPQ